jgi:hypothetical protein
LTIKGNAVASTANDALLSLMMGVLVRILAKSGWTSAFIVGQELLLFWDLSGGRYDSKTRGFAFLLKSDVYVMDKRVVEISERE